MRYFFREMITLLTKPHFILDPLLEIVPVKIRTSTHFSKFLLGNYARRR